MQIDGMNVQFINKVCVYTQNRRKKQHIFKRIIIFMQEQFTLNIKYKKIHR